MLSHGMRISLAFEPVDMLLSFDGLAARIQHGDVATRLIFAGHKAELPRKTRSSIGGTACAEQRVLCVHSKAG